VGDDHLVAVTDEGQLLDGVDDMVLLNFGGGLLTSLQECVTA
jgi:hypothetical protein